MLPRDFVPTENPAEYRAALEAWETRQNELVAQQDAAAEDVVRFRTARTELESWATELADVLDALAGHRDRLAAGAPGLDRIEAEITEADGLIADHTEARAVATSRLLGGPDSETPVVLLPLRLQTRWIAGTLHVRIYPDELAVDAHDPTLTAEEARWAAHARAVDDGTVAADPEETWEQLVRRFGPNRAAWLVTATRPGRPAPQPRTGLLPAPATVRLLPDRFAVVAYSAGQPIDVGPPDGPARYVTWTDDVSRPLTLDPHDADSATPAWWSDLTPAGEAGMAVAIAPKPGRPPIELLVVVGVSSADPDAVTAELTELLGHHAFTSGIAVLPDGAATNNGAADRSAYGPRARERAARAVRDATDAAPPPSGSAGAGLSRVLGLPPDALSGTDGSSDERDAVPAAARLLLGLGAGGALRDALGADAPWSLLRPDGPAATLLAGRRPYGALPVSAAGRWTPRDGETGAGLAPALHRFAAATGPVVATDPGTPPTAPVGGTARTDPTAVVGETGTALAWSGDADTAVTGTDGLVGPVEGPSSAAAALTTLADTDPAALGALPPEVREGSLLVRIALAAKRIAPGDPVDDALRTLAAADRDRLARTVAGLLDAASHRFDAWATAAVTERLERTRDDRPGATAVGAVGWLTDVYPSRDAGTYGHVHAPSLGHAVTAAVLRSGFLGERRRVWNERIDDTRALGDRLRRQMAEAPATHQPMIFEQVQAVEERLAGEVAAAARLDPLDADDERRLPLGVDLSSGRVRGALRLLDAVRAGSPLAAVLGYQFERDLVDAGLGRYLAAFRKLTRFHTGTELEGLEKERGDKRTALRTAEKDLESRRLEAERLRGVRDEAAKAAAAAVGRENAATAAWSPLAALEQERADVAAGVAQLEADVAVIDARKPRPPVETFHVTLP